MTSPQVLIEQAATIESQLGYTFQNKQLLAMAFTHCSFVNEIRDEPCEHNERLEFLGDGVLNLILADYLYHHLPNVPEGELSYKRSRLVDATACLKYLHHLHVDQYLLLGKGERRNDGRGRDSILSNLFEAIIGAIYLDSGLEAAKTFFVARFTGIIAEALAIPDQNAKAQLQNFAQSKLQQQPTYQVLESSGPDHDKHFVIGVYLGDQEVGRGSGRSKKEAQQAAAADALTRLNPSLD